jgi:general stress protein 26
MQASMSQSKREHLVTILKDFDTAMLMTRTGSGQLRARPMALAEVQSDGTVYLAAQINSEKVNELIVEPSVGLAMQGKMKFASVSGRATVSRDRGLIERLWKDSWKVWFPKGKSDPDICIIAFDAMEGEYWDNSGLSGVKFVIKAAKALLSGEELRGSGDESANAKVQL